MSKSYLFTLNISVPNLNADFWLSFLLLVELSQRLHSEQWSSFDMLLWWTMSSWHASVSLYSSAYTTLWKNWSRYCFKFQFKQLPTYLIEHNHIGIILLCLKKSQWRVYKTQSKSDWLFNTQAIPECCNMIGRYRKIVRRQLWILTCPISCCHFTSSTTTCITCC